MLAINNSNHSVISSRIKKKNIIDKSLRIDYVIKLNLNIMIIISTLFPRFNQLFHFSNMHFALLRNILNMPTTLFNIVGSS